MSLKQYKQKRQFNKTPEPAGEIENAEPANSVRPLFFVVQQHDATRLHFDLRIEWAGTLKSWAITKSPSLNPTDQRLAVFVEDHPLDYGSFEGVIPKGNYGAGTVMIWDYGTVVERSSQTREQSEINFQKGLEKGAITFVVHGHRLNGEFALIQLKDSAKNWLLIKKRDQFVSYKADSLDFTRSIVSNRTMQEIAEQSLERKDFWLPGSGSTKTLREIHLTPDPPQSAQQRVVQQDAPSIQGVPSKKGTDTSIGFMRPKKSIHPITGKGWKYFLQWPGFRVHAKVDARTTIKSKIGKNYAPFCPEIVELLQAQGRDAVFDGTLVGISESGDLSKDSLRAPVQAQNVLLIISDVLRIDGKSQADRPLQERYEVLNSLRFPPDGPILVDPHFDQVPTLSQLAGRHSRLRHIKLPKPVYLAKDWRSSYLRGIQSSWRSFEIVPVEDQTVRITHPDRVYWPNQGYTKRDLADYYQQVSKQMLPFLENRPLSLNRHPDGIHGEGFFQKNMIGYHPPYVHTHRIQSRSTGKSIDYILCQNAPTLQYLANLGCIEIHGWLSKIPNIDHPDYLVIDLDPNGQPFQLVKTIAQCVHEVLDELNCPNFVKTSGSTGVHVCVPLNRTASTHSYDQALEFAQLVCERVHRIHPSTTSVERSPSKRRGKLYLDALQNRRSQTLALPYCVRPREHAPVSTPLAWEELPEVQAPEQFHMRNIPARVLEHSNIWELFFKTEADLGRLIPLLRSSER